MPAGEPVDPPSPEVVALQRELRALRAQMKVQAHKMLLMHRALAAGGVLGPAELDSPTAEAAAEVLHRIGSPHAVLSFGSKGQGIYSPRPEMAGTLLELGVDVLFYRDFQQAWWCQGLMGLSRDVASTAEYLRGRMRQFGYRRVMTTGASMGGYGAILFGVMIGAERIVAFGPQTRVNLAAFERYEGTDARAVRFDFRGRDADLARVLEEIPYDGRIEIHFSTGSGTDALQARHLERFPQVSLHPHDSEDHNTAAVLKAEGRLGGLFRFG